MDPSVQPADGAVVTDETEEEVVADEVLGDEDAAEEVAEESEEIAE